MNTYLVVTTFCSPPGFLQLGGDADHDQNEVKKGILPPSGVAHAYTDVNPQGARPMQLHEVDVVKELFTAADVNKALQEGWRIVAVVPVPVPGVAVACYVMGRYAQPASQIPDGGFQQTVR